MKTKNSKTASYITGFMLGAFLLKDIFKYPALLKNTSENPVSFLIPQGVYVLGLICLVIFFATILQTIKKNGVFVRKTEIKFRQFGFIIVLLAISSNILFEFLTGEYNINVRWLALLGGTIAFVSFILQVGIKLQEEQNLTI
ncbi:MAG: hypothetical protein Q4G48_03535 [Bacteroidia bacterium]|nr:hypothetical protein [Bacteroidia bacterium]